jgi:hypothetical protein
VEVTRSEQDESIDGEEEKRTTQNCWVEREKDNGQYRTMDNERVKEKKGR